MLPTKRRGKVRLKPLAEAAGFNGASLAALTGIDEGTVSRHWNNSAWADSISGPNLLKLATVVPGLADALVSAALADRFAAAFTEIEENGAEIDREAVRAAIDGKVIAQYLCTGLVAVAKLLSGSVADAEIALRSCWGREQTRALDVAFCTHGSWHALKSSTALMEAARRAFDELAAMPGYSFYRCIALTHLTHHLGKATGEILAEPVSTRGARGWTAGFYVRGAYMGKLRHGGSGVETADQYHEIVAQHDNAHAVEKWAFPRWVGDVPPAEGFDLPEHVALNRTAVEILHEIDNYNETYVYYLAKTFIPLAVEEMDASFGGRRTQLAAALRRRAETTTNPVIGTQLLDTAALAEQG